MKRVVLFLVPLALAAIAFSVTLFVLNRNYGKGALQVTSAPQSKVYLNGKLIGSTPLCKCEVTDMLPVGDYTIKLVPSEGNFNPIEDKITINKSVLTVVDRNFDKGALPQGSILTLSPISDKKDAQLLIISFPDKGNVFLDSNPVGITPLLLKNISDVDHEIKVEKNGYKDKTIKIKTTKGYRLISLMFLGLNPIVASASASIFASPSASPAISKVIILSTPTGFLRVRETNSTTSAEIGKAYPEETFDLIDERSGWFEIKLKDGKTGWISSQYAKKE